MSTQISTTDENVFARHREKWFIAALIVGVLTFALGMAFGILTISMDTTPPAPYFASTTDMYLTGASSAVFMVVGVFIVLRGAKLGGW